MNLLSSRSAILVIVSTFTLGWMPSAFADISGFNNGVGYTATGNPTYTPSSPVFAGNQVTLTVGPSIPCVTNCVGPLDAFGILFNDTPQMTSAWTASFVYQATDPQGLCFCDGTAFIIQNAPAGVLAQPLSQLIGGYFGYLGIPNSLAIELSPDSSGINPGGPGTGLYFGSTPQFSHPLLQAAPVLLNSQDPILVNVSYNGQLSEQLTDTINGNVFSVNYGLVDLPSILGSSTAYVGFSGAFGLGDSTQTVSDFSFCDDGTCNPPTYPNTGVAPTPTPEPNFYGASLIFMLGLAVAVKRRRAAMSVVDATFGGM